MNNWELSTVATWETIDKKIRVHKGKRERERERERRGEKEKERKK